MRETGQLEGNTNHQHHEEEEEEESESAALMPTSGDGGPTPSGGGGAGGAAENASNRIEMLDEEGGMQEGSVMRETNSSDIEGEREVDEISDTQNRDNLNHNGHAGSLGGVRKKESPSAVEATIGEETGDGSGEVGEGTQYSTGSGLGGVESTFSTASVSIGEEEDGEGDGRQVESYGTEQATWYVCVCMCVGARFCFLYHFPPLLACAWLHRSPQPVGLVGSSQPSPPHL